MRTSRKLLRRMREAGQKPIKDLGYTQRAPFNDAIRIQVWVQPRKIFLGEKGHTGIGYRNSSIQDPLATGGRQEDEEKMFKGDTQ